jgi:hypothetical protein
MVREFIVNPDRYYQDVKGKMYSPGERIMCDDELPHNKSQMFKLIPVETTYDYEDPNKKPETVEQVLEVADKIIAKHKEETPILPEPPKAVKPEKKPAQDIPKDKAKNMLERVQEFVEQQEKDKKK